MFSTCILAISVCLVTLRYATSRIINQKYLLSNLLRGTCVFLVELFDDLWKMTFSRYGAVAPLFLSFTIAFVYILLFTSFCLHSFCSHPNNTLYYFRSFVWSLFSSDLPNKIYKSTHTFHYRSYINIRIVICRYIDICKVL